MNIQPVRPLRNHQIKAVDKFIPRTCAALFHDPGCGKTTTAINLLREWINIENRALKTVIVAPVATLHNWQNEFVLNAPGSVQAETEVIYLKGKRTKLTLVQRAERIKKTKNSILILNIASIQSDAVVMALQAFKPDCLILDESHEFKAPRMTSRNPGKRTKSRLAQLLSVSDTAKYRIIMTGTPVLNGYLDLWAQFRILDKGEALGQNFFVFREKYFQDKNISWRGKPNYFPLFVPRPGIAGEIEKLIADKSDRVKIDECLDLPEHVFKKHYVELSGDQEKAYFDMQDELVAEVKGGTCAATNALTKTLRLLQILGGSLTVENTDTPNGEVVPFVDNTRLAALEKLLLETTPMHKVIVWSNFRADYGQIRGLLVRLGIAFVEHTGESSGNHAAVDIFQTQDQIRAMLANPQSGGVGINLTASDVSIYYSRGYSLMHRIQSLARNRRDGSQKHTTITVYDIVAKNTLDEEVLDALLKKEDFSENVLERIKKLG